MQPGTISGRFQYLLAFVLVMSLLIMPTAQAHAPIDAAQQEAGSPAPFLSDHGEQARLRELIAKAQVLGRVRVIVGLDPAGSFQPEGFLQDEKKEAQRDFIALAQARLLRALAGYDVTVAAQYRFIPSIALDVDARALQALAQVPFISSITESEQLVPALDNSVPWINADDLHYGVGGDGYAVAIIDSGIDRGHPTFEDGDGQSRVVLEACYSEESVPGDRHTLCPDGSTAQIGTGAAAVNTTACNSGSLCWHGTHVAGIAAGSYITCTGVAPEADIVAIQVFYRRNTTNCGDQTPPCIVSDTADQITALEQALSWASTHDIAAVNLSMASATTYAGDCDSSYPDYANAVNNLVSAGIAVVAATGNDGHASAIAFPACLSNVVSVAATDDNSDSTYGLNNIGDGLDLFAPGIGIKSALPNGAWSSETGTSMAAPHVTGAWALMKELSPGASLSEIEFALTTSGPEVSQHDVTRHRLDVLEAGGMLDVIPPTVSSHNHGTYPATMIYVTFDEHMDPRTFTNSTVVVFGSSSGIHTGAYSFDQASLVLTIDPNTDFSYGETVYVTISPIVTDLVGNALTIPYQFNFAVDQHPGYMISGYVRDTGGSGIGSVWVSAGSRGAYTNSSGYYEIGGLTPAQYTVTPTKPGYTFTPSSVVVELTSNRTVNFTGTVYQSGDTFTFLATEDAYLRQAAPSTPYNTACVRGGKEYYGGTYQNVVGLLKFADLSTNPAIQGKTVYDAALKLYVSSNDLSTRLRLWAIGLSAGIWNESSTYNTFPYESFDWYDNYGSMQGSANFNVGTGDVGTWLTIRGSGSALVENYVEGIIKGLDPNYGLLIDGYYSNVDSDPCFSSSEGSNPPQLWFQILTGVPDLVISSISTTPAPGAGNRFNVGDSIRIDHTVFNNGPGGADSSTAAVYLGTTPTDLSLQLDTASTSQLLAGDDDSDYSNYTFTAGDAGTRYLIVRADDESDVAETDENNNVSWIGPFEIVQPNQPPSISGLPDRTLDEDGELDNTIDLWAYAGDPESSDDQLIYYIHNAPDPGAGVTIDANRYVDIDPAANWCGATDVEVGVVDPQGLSATDSLHVTVNCINDLPWIAPAIADQTEIPDVAIVLDLTGYEHDVEDSGTALDWYVTGLDHCAVSGQYSDDDLLTFTPQAAYLGSDEITLHLVDTGGGQATQTVSLTWAMPDDAGPVIGSPDYDPTIPSNEQLVVTVSISDLSTGDHGVVSATLSYGYQPPYDDYAVDGTGPGGNGDGTWTFVVPSQGSSHEGDTLRFSITAADGDDTPAFTTADNNGLGYPVLVSDDDIVGPAIVLGVVPPQVVSAVPLTITAEISDALAGDHGVVSATLSYGYEAPYNQYYVAATGPGGNGDGTWTFVVPPQGPDHEGETLRFGITAADGDNTPAHTTDDNNGLGYPVGVTDDDTLGPGIALTVAPTQVVSIVPLTVIAAINDTATGSHGVISATLSYGYEAPYGQYQAAGAGPGGSGDGGWTFMIPPQGPAHEGQTLRFAITAVDGDNTPARTTADNGGAYYPVTILPHGFRAYLPYVARQATIPDNRPPQAPANPSPQHGVANQPLHVTLGWTGGDPDGDLVTYDVYFEAGDSTPDILVADNQVEITFDPGLLAPATAYYWQIVATDEHGLTTAGPIWTFATTQPPYTPADPSPPNGATGQAITLTLGWTGGDPDGDLVTYDVYMEADDDTPDVLVCDDQGSPACDPGPLSYLTHYFWLVVAVDQHGATATGPVWDWTTEEEPIGWRVETVDSTGDVGTFTSLALGALDRPRIAYADQTNRDLKYASRDGAGWITETVDSLGNVGDWPSLAVDASGRPHISYLDWPGAYQDHLKYTYHDGAAWQIQTVDGTNFVGAYSSLKIDSLGQPHISYYDAGSTALKYARYVGSGGNCGPGGAWQCDIVDNSASVGEASSLALDSANLPHISYYQHYAGDLRYAYYDGAAWHTETVDSDGNVGAGISLAVDSAGRPHIGYYDFTNQDLKYAYHDGTSWHIETVDSAGDVGQSPSLALDAAGRPHISYYDGVNGDLKYAWHDGTSWWLEVADSAGNVGTATSLALDAAGQPHISYYNASTGDLMYAFRGSAAKGPSGSRGAKLFPALSLARSKLYTPRPM